MAFLRERWFWVAFVLCAYQIGIAMFLILQMLINDYYIGIPARVPFFGMLAISIALYVAIYFQKNVTAAWKWIMVSIVAVICTLVGAYATGEPGIQAVLLSYVGIPISYQLFFGFNAVLGLIALGQTILTWLFLLVKAPKISWKTLQQLTTFMVISMLISLAGCAMVTQIRD